jgi:DHA1 family bicyclomycin/chloramphenicol resistance-like MFS transporter
VSSKNLNPSARPRPFFIAGLALMMTFPPLAIDMFLPALTRIGQEFEAPQSYVEWTLTAFLLGFGIGQIFWGALSDRAGRKLPIIAGILLYTFGCIGCSLSPTIFSLAIWRFIQALGACAGPVLARAMVRDSFARDRAASVLSLMLLLMGAAPLAAPFMGGYVLLLADWRMIFWVQAGFGGLALLAIFLMPETLPRTARSKPSLSQMLANYKIVLTNWRFLGYAICSSFIFAGLFAYIAGTPYIYIEIFKVPPEQYGYLFGINIFGMMMISLINAKMVLRHGSDILLRIGCLSAGAIGLTLLFFAMARIGGLAALAGTLFLFLSIVGLISANAMAGAMADFPHIAGSASALVGLSQFAFGAAGAAAVGFFANGTAVSMAAVICAAGLCSSLSNLLLCKIKH